mgnify:CR=1 FL=1
MLEDINLFSRVKYCFHHSKIKFLATLIRRGKVYFPMPKLRGRKTSLRWFPSTNRTTKTTKNIKPTSRWTILLSSHDILREMTSNWYWKIPVSKVFTSFLHICSIRTKLSDKKKKGLRHFLLNLPTLPFLNISYLVQITLLLIFYQSPSNKSFFLAMLYVKLKKNAILLIPHLH